MKAIVVGRDAELLYPMMKEAGIGVAKDSAEADAVFCHGGDGTLIGAERDYPGLPKVPVRPDVLYTKCPRHVIPELFGKLSRGEHASTKLPILEAVAKRQSILALNDIVLHNAKITSAVRYRMWINSKPYSDIVIGDGLVVSTPFGSTGYYRSITNSVIRVGIGLAFNNSTESINHLVLEDTARIEVEVTRGPGLLVADNMHEPLPLEQGDRIVIHRAAVDAEVWEVDSLLCMDCRNRETGKPAGHLHVR